jgi:cytochrome c oxidase subunit 4
MKPPWPLPVRDLVLAWAGLLALLAVSVATVVLPPAPWKTPFRLLLAGAQIALVAAFYMKLRFRRGLVRIFAGAGLFWLGMLAALVFADYLTRR